MARKRNRPELLAPAGNLEKLKIAIHYGADAVYIGGQKYGLRSNAGNFSLEEMREGVQFAHRYGAEVFVTTNIYAHNEDLADLDDYLRDIQSVGVSAIITADPVIIERAQEVAPKMEVHLSTQQSTMNWQAVQFWKDQGIPRVVLARETSFDDIRAIKQNVDIEIEAFIHGAMCSSYSGRCVLSNHFTDRDSNRGGCSQSCRWQYDLYQGDQKHRMFDIEEDSFTMGAKDLGMIEAIPEIIEAGIDSLKIEGRMKSIHYVASVVHAYRQAIDAYLEDPENYVLKPEWKEEILKAANRPLNSGFYWDTPDFDDHIYEKEDKKVPFDFAGLVLDYDTATRRAKIEQRNHFRVGQEVEFFGPTGMSFRQQVISIMDEEGNALEAARHPQQVVWLEVEQPVRAWDLIRKKAI